MKVKICGITDKETALAAADLGADAIGFVFAESKRKIDEETAREIAEILPSNIMKVGVFVNESKENMELIADYVGLTHIQLHGNESHELSQSLPFSVIKAVSIEEGMDLSYITDYPADFLLLDGPKGKYIGGNGISFNWNEIDSKTLNGKSIILAGGLNPENVQEAIQTINPVMVDVSSGVETNGIKDIKKIRKFIEQAKKNKGRITQ
ncbi:phosphoribosylanthranilate isomerase [Neobacillus terrae]|uniref:phosphoribosylanthranilate isomerase n=1 Tax=Neobacillus terrae TaxID=3034837 RepID=UPI001408C696|nr:phosphoribosylanthranilate isomerase [Neobacillus terrae]NHM29384.1 phosphoribosylanthranilate isomerase [Neobacillus terrae]